MSVELKSSGIKACFIISDGDVNIEKDKPLRDKHHLGLIKLIRRGLLKELRRNK